MRVVLFHNESAGSENHAADHIEAEVRRAGHHVVLVATELSELLPAVLDNACDVVAIAGGDGTVSHAACTLAGRQVPLAILPLGTANNTAKSLGIDGHVEKLAASWAEAERRAYDLATIQVNGDTLTPFSEAVGWGAFPDLMRRTEQMPSPERREHTLERDRRLLCEELERGKLRPYEIEVEGSVVRGEFLLVEIINIPFLGPQLELSPESNPSDGYFELLLAGEPEREALIELANGANGSSGVRLPIRRVKHAIVHGNDAWFHRDGSLVEFSGRPNECSVAVEPASVRYLVPR